MMKYLVFSDSHGSTDGMLNVMEREAFRGVLFLGDGARDIEKLSMAFPDKDICAVRGNNDWYSDFCDDCVAVLDGVRVFMAHGHTCGAREGTDVLVYRAKEKGCTVALYGHTHSPVCKEEDGITVLNPGSITYTGTYGILTFEKGRVKAEIKQTDA